MMDEYLSNCLHDESDPIYVVLKLLKRLRQSTALSIPWVISLLGFVPEPSFIATQVPVNVFVFLLRDRPPPRQAGVNSHNYTPNAVANV